MMTNIVLSLFQLINLNKHLMNLNKILAVAAMAAVASMSMANNPIIQTSYTPDPAPYVHNDTVYLFVDHDEDDAQYFKMKDWQLYTSTDMLNWTYEGTPMSTVTFKWAKQGDNAWASQAIERDGKWYWYICAEDTTVHLHGIGVGVSDTPRRPLHRPARQAARCRRLRLHRPLGIYRR